MQRRGSNGLCGKYAEKSIWPFGPVDLGLLIVAVRICSHRSILGTSTVVEGEECGVRGQRI